MRVGELQAHREKDIQNGQAAAPKSLHWLTHLVCFATLSILLIGCAHEQTGEDAIADGTILPDTGTVLVEKMCPPDTVSPLSVDGVNAPADWRSFRKLHPYHIQQIAVGSPRSDGSRSVLITEPPPRVCLSDIQGLSAKLARARTVRWRMGFDGWVQDVVAQIPATDSLALDMLLLDLNRLLFGTAYQARVVALGSTDATVETPRLDFRVTAAELREWMLTDSETFSPTGEGAGISLAGLLARRAHGEFFSKNPGFVLWILPRGQDVTRYLSTAQSWANDADIVLGGIADDQTVAIVGRERQVSKAILPPLRIETIHTIAGSGTDHLAQSYERTYLYSGRFDSRNDWAPIYLSPVLIDDEYGSLLNITDQLLKSWSEHGTVHYINFPYPRPERYPFDMPLHERLHAGTVTYNWNTRGAGYVADENGYRVYALNRTGALPVSYFAGDEQSKSEETNNAEEVAYEYFASLNDPNLARVVQYAALYQLFREFGVGIPSAVGEQKDAHEALRDQTERMLELLASLPAEKVQAANASDSSFAVFAYAVSAINAIRAVSEERGLQVLAARLSRGRPTQAQLAADAVLYERAFVGDSIRDELSTEDRIAAMAMRDERIITRALQTTLESLPVEITNRARETFVVASARPAGRWIRTASVVQSTSAKLTWIGGHNLDAAVTRVRASADIAKGEVKVITEDGRTVILANEADVPKLSSNIREIAGLTEESNGGARISQMLAELRELPVRPRLEVIPPPPRLASAASIPDRSLLGFERVHRSLSDGELSAANIMKTRGRPFTSIQRFDNGSFEIVLGDPPHVVRAGNTASAIDAVVQRSGADVGSLQLQLAGFSERDANAFTRNVEFSYRKTGRAQREVRSAVRDVQEDQTAAARILSTEADFSKARVKPIERVEVTTESGLVKEAYKVEIEVPSLVATEPSLLLRIVMVIREGLAPSIEAVQAAINQAIASLRGTVTADAAALAIKRELQRSFGNTIDVTTHAGDMLIVRLYAPEGGVGED